MAKIARRQGTILRPWILVATSVAVVAGLIAAIWHMAGPGYSGGDAGDLVLFCANGMLKPVQEICDDYEEQYGVKVHIEPDSSGGLLSKLRVAGEQADLFLAGEESIVREARRQGLVAEESCGGAAARGRGRRARQSAEDRGVQGPAPRRGPRGIPNPKLTAVGRSAERALAGGDEWTALIARSASSRPRSRWWAR